MAAGIVDRRRRVWLRRRPLAGSGPPPRFTVRELCAGRSSGAGRGSGNVPDTRHRAQTGSEDGVGRGKGFHAAIPGDEQDCPIHGKLPTWTRCLAGWRCADLAARRSLVEPPTASENRQFENVGGARRCPPHSGSDTLIMKATRILFISGFCCYWPSL